VNERLDATVRGYVQGVGFRWFVVRHAARLRLTGWTSNEPDGSVRVVAEGPAAALDELLARLKEGPGGASVETIDAQRSSAQGNLDSFTIRAGAHRGD
jgi:acylphosphatase